MLKKWIVFIICLLLPNVTLAQVAPLDETDLTFTYKDTIYHLGENAAPLIDAIGEMDVFEMESCLFDGMDKEFSNDSLVVGTYPCGVNGQDVVETIMVLTADIPTPRGAKIGMRKEDIIALYGQDFTLDYDQMSYAMDHSSTCPMLVFAFDISTDIIVSYYMIRNSM